MAVDISMWGKALQQMPRLDRDQWRALDPVAKWLVATRASVLIMTFNSAALGGLLAWRNEAFNFTPWLIATLGLLLAHATNNLLNDYTDSRRGIDRNNYYRNQYGVHLLEDKLVGPRGFWLYLGLTGAAALLCGAYLVANQPGLTLDLMLAGVFFVLFYTWPLKYFGLGEPAVLLVWGPLMVGGAYYVTAGQWDWHVAWLSLLFALGPTTVLFGKHTDKLEADRARGVNTLPVLLGEARSRWAVKLMLVSQYLLTAALVVAGIAHWALLAVFIALPRLRDCWQVFSQPKPDAKPEGYPESIWPLWFSAQAFRHTRVFTSLFLVGILIDSMIMRFFF